MIWTDDYPKKDGWYWWRLYSVKPHIREVLCGKVKVVGREVNVAEAGGQWAGPILLPVEKEEAAKLEHDRLME